MKNQSDTSNRLAHYIPALQWIPAYQKEWLTPDIIGGLSAAAVVIPQAMGYAALAGLPVQVGLYASLFPMIAYALLGTSRVLSVSVTSTISLLTAATIASVASSADASAYLSAAGALAVMVGLFLILGSFLNLGGIANLISQPVLLGFKTGIGIVIFTGQIGKILGIPVTSGSFPETVASIVQNLGQTNWLTLMVSLIVFAILIFLPRLTRKAPPALVAVAAAIAVSALFNLQGRGVAVVGDVPAGLPGFTLPDMSVFRQVFGGALAIALFSFIESIATARAFVRSGEPKIRANQELLALGFANLAGGLTMGYPGGGGASQTAINRDAGARTQLSGLTTAGMVVLTLLFLAPLIAFMPTAALGAMVMLAAFGLIKPQELTAIQRVSKVEYMWALAALLGVIFLGTLEGILVAMAISIITIFLSSSQPPLYILGQKSGTDVFRPLSDEHPDDKTYPGLMLVRTEGRLNFASAPNIEDEMWDFITEYDPKVIAFDLDAVPEIEYTALNILTNFDRQLAEQNRTLWLLALNPAVLATLRRAPLGERLTNDRLFFNAQEAVSAFQQRYAQQE